MAGQNTFNFHFSTSSQQSQQQQILTNNSSIFASLFHQSQPQRRLYDPLLSDAFFPRDLGPTPMLIDDTPPLENPTSTSSSSLNLKVNEKVGFVEDAKRRVNELKEENLDGLFCTICMEPSGSQGDHQVSCLPCGHVYGYSCIKRWVQRCAVSKCPQCNAKCKVKDIRKLYTSPVTIVDEELQKKVECLEAEVGSLKKERSDWLKAQDDLLKANENLLKVQDNMIKVQDKLFEGLLKCKQNPACVQSSSFIEKGRNPFGFVFDKVAHADQSGYPYGPNLGRQQLLRCNFVLEHELDVEGARLFDIDVSCQNLILARRISGMGGMHMLNKINLISPYKNEDIRLPPSTKAVKDLQISPCGKLTLLASLGKKLSILSMGSNDVVITYDLRVPAWSCSWDRNSKHYLYIGLENGTLLVFDMRQLANPLHSMVGPVCRPIHTIHSLVHNPALGDNARKLLTASSLGPCVWDIGSGERPIPVPVLEREGICTSLAYGLFSDDIVASYTPKSQRSNVPFDSQSSDPEPSGLLGQAIMGSQVHVKRVAGTAYHNLGSRSAYINEVQIVKSAIINMDSCCPLFAYGDALTNRLVLKELPSLTTREILKPHLHPISDVRYAYTEGTCLLGCASEDKLQLFSAKAL